MEAANDRGETPLHVAVLNCKVDAVRFLIQAVAPFGLTTSTRLQFSVVLLSPLR